MATASAKPCSSSSQPPGTSEATATSITLAGDPPAASGIVFEVPTGRIDLTVTDGGTPYTQGFAVLVRADAIGQEVQQDSNGFDGFSFTDLAPGTYKVRFHTISMFGCGCTWVGGSSFETAQVITVGAGAVTDCANPSSAGYANNLLPLDFANTFAAHTTHPVVNYLYLKMESLIL